MMEEKKRKVKMTGCYVTMIGTKWKRAAIGVGFMAGEHERLRQVACRIADMAENLDGTIGEKSALLMAHLMQEVHNELDGCKKADADTADLENFMRQKMPLLIRKAVNHEFYTELIKE